MLYYRFYFIDAAGHIEDVRECLAEDHAAATAEARRLDDGRMIEIWCQGKKIGEVRGGKERRQG